MSAQSAVRTRSIDLEGLCFVSDMVAKLRRDLEEDVEEEDDVIFVGHSQGGLVVQSHLATGGAARGAILMAPVPLDAALFARHAIRLALKVPALGLLRSVATLNSRHVLAPDLETMRRNFFLDSTQATTRVGDESSLLLRNKKGTSLADYFENEVTQADSAVAGLRCRGNARDIAVPTLVLAAEHDRLVDLDLLEALAAMIPHAELIVVRNQAHAFADPGWEHALCGPIRRFIQRTLERNERRSER